MDNTLREIEELVSRIKVFFHGPCKSGKSTIIRHLTGDSSIDDRQDIISDGVMVTLWRPFPEKDVTNDTANLAIERHNYFYEHFFGKRGENFSVLIYNINYRGKEVLHDEGKYKRHLCFEFWELSWKKVFQGVHEIYLTAGSIHVVVVDLTLLDVTYILEKWNQIQNKIPGSKVILVITKADMKDESSIISATKMIRQRLLDNEDALQTFLIKKIHYLKSIGAADGDIQRVMDVQRQRSKQTWEIVCIRGTSGKARLRSLAIETLQQRKAVLQNGKMLKGSIDALRKHMEEFIVMAKRDFVDTVLPGELDDTVENSLSILESSGQILDLRYLNTVSDIEKEYICVNPAIFAKLMCAFHVDNDHMTFKIDAQRFWPIDSGFKRPDSSALERVLESLTSFGLLREALFPILWQDIILPEDQMIDLIKVAESLALLIRHEPSSSDSEGLALPAFLSLSVIRQFRIILLDRIKDNKPLNWTSKPLQGDIQIGWRYAFPQGTSTGLLQRLLGCCKNTSLVTEDYEYMWKSGLLKKVDQGITCVEVEENNFTISIRVNTEEFDSQEKAVQTAWTVIIPLVSNTFFFLRTWAGLCFEVFVVFSGNQFANSENADVVTTLPVPEILIKSRRHKTATFVSNGALVEINIDMLFPFQGSMEAADSTSVIEHWITLVLSHRHEFLTSSESGQQRCRLPEQYHGGDIITQAKKQAKRTTKMKGQLVEVIRLAPERDEDAQTVSRHYSKWTLLHRRKEIRWNVDSDDIMSARVKMDRAKHQDSNKVQTSQKEQLQHVSTRATSDQEGLKIQTSDGHQRTDWGPDDRFMIESAETASLFTAAVLASAVAKFVEEESRINPQWSNDVTAEQVKVAQLAAESAEDPNSGSALSAVQSVIDAIHAVKIRFQLREQEKYRRKQRSHTCLLL